MNQKYEHLFFDLDHTLWDFEANSILTLREMITLFELEKTIESFDNFYAVYYPINRKMWDDYEKNIVTKDEVRVNRFLFTLQQFGIDNRSLALDMANYYTTHSPTKGQLIHNAEMVLETLMTRYKLHLITNGFKEVQFIKINSTSIGKYFDEIIISEMIGKMKPAQEIFDYALEKTLAGKDNSVMIGDSLYADIDGALNYGMDAIFFNPGRISHSSMPTYEIFELKQLLEIL